MRKTMMARHILPFAFALLAVACDGDPERTPLTDSASARPIGIQDGLFFASSERNALSIDVATSAARITEHALSAPAVVTLPRTAGGSEVVVLTRGLEARTEDGERQLPVSSELLLFNRERMTLPQPHQLKGRFERLALSEDGRFALAYSPLGVGAQNQVEVIDLAKLETAAPEPSTQVNFSLTGVAPTQFIFSPAGVGKRRLVVVPFPDSVQLLDLERPTARPTSIPLKTANDPRSISPQKVVFAGDRIFVQATGMSQVFAITLLDSVPANGFEPSFEPSFELLTTASPVSDIALVGEGDQQRLLALAGRLEVFEPLKGSSISLDGVRDFSAMLPFIGGSPTDANSASRALVYTPGQRRIGFVDLIGESEWATRTIETLELGQPIRALVELKRGELALALHDTSALSVIDLVGRTVDTLRLDGPLVDWLIDATPERLRLWLLTPTTLAVTDLSNLATTEVPLAVSVTYSLGDEDDERFASGDVSTRRSGQLVLIPGAMQRRVAVLHASEAGRITLIDANTPTDRTSWLELAGYSLAGLLD